MSVLKTLYTLPLALSLIAGSGSAVLAADARGPQDGTVPTSVSSGSSQQDPGSTTPPKKHSHLPTKGKKAKKVKKAKKPAVKHKKAKKTAKGSKKASRPTKKGHATRPSTGARGR